MEIKALLHLELQKLVDSNLIKPETAKFPYLGEIPVQDQIVPEDNEGVEEEDDEDDDSEGGDESDDSPEGKRRGRGRPRLSMKGKGDEASRDDAHAVGDNDPRKRRGRPPRVDTPMEARIKNILKSFRRFKDDDKEPKINNFERLPDRAIMPGYYEEIKAPMAVDVMKVDFRLQTKLCRVDIDISVEKTKTQEVYVSRAIHV